MRISVAQLNPFIADFEGNLKKIERTLSDIEKTDTDLVVFSELILSGYPPLDLLERKDFVNQCLEAQKELVRLTRKYGRTAVLFGNIQPTGYAYGKGLYNSAILVQDGKILFRQDKTLLPTYDVFDEARYFDAAKEINTFDFKGERLGITICEDAWNDAELFPETLYPVNPVEILSERGATLFINISASPFGIGKDEIRYRLFRNHAIKHQKPFVFANQVGANDELISDGNSMVLAHNGDPLCLFPAFVEHVQTIDLKGNPEIQPFTPQDRIASVFDALNLGVQDYMAKCGFQKAVLGLSGGIDSALICCIASEALGPENVVAVSMPSPYSSKASVEDARKLAETLNVDFRIVPIDSLFEAFRHSVEAHFRGMPEDATEENIQARIRGNILMALSNKLGYLPLSSGNKSELSVGYCTLYGDMSGGLSVLSDVPKTMVYALAEYINRDREIIPGNILVKPPSAELKPGQKDEDTLPPYPLLDRIIHLYIDRGASRDEIIDAGIEAGTVDWVIAAIQKNEYKRRQAVPGLKITSKACGTGRRMPIAAKNFV